MSKEQLAIASVPVQDYGEIYDDKKALCEGTIFSELDMPFFAADGENGKSSGKSALFGMNQKLPEEKEREELMTKLTEVSFVLDDLTLYLDTHGDEEQAVSLYEQKLTERETRETVSLTVQKKKTADSAGRRGRCPGKERVYNVAV